MPQILNHWVNVPVELHQKITSLLKIALTAERADKCTFQVYDEPKGVLRIIAHEGFEPEFLENFREVKPFDSSSCGRAIGVGSTIVVSDTMKDVSFMPHQEIMKAAGVYAVKSVPIFSENNKRLGVFSTHFNETKSIWNLDLLGSISREMAHILSKISDGLGAKA